MPDTALRPVEEASHPYLSGRFAPVHRELDADDLLVVGSLPTDIDGVFMRNGPNPKFRPLGSFTYPLEGDGMIHAVWIQAGRARYRNRWVRTGGLCAEEQAGPGPVRRAHDPSVRGPEPAWPRPGSRLAVQARRLHQRCPPRRSLPRPGRGHPALRGQPRARHDRPVRLRRAASARHVRPPALRSGDRRHGRVPLRHRAAVPDLGRRRPRRLTHPAAHQGPLHRQAVHGPRLHDHRALRVVCHRSRRSQH